MLISFAAKMSRSGEITSMVTLVSTKSINFPLQLLNPSRATLVVDLKDASGAAV